MDYTPFRKPMFYPTNTPHIRCTGTNKNGDACERIVPTKVGLCQWHHPEAKIIAHRNLQKALDRNNNWGRPTGYANRGSRPSPRVPDSYAPWSPDPKEPCPQCNSLTSLYSELDTSDIVCRTCGRRWFTGETEELVLRLPSQSVGSRKSWSE